MGLLGKHQVPDALSWCSHHPARPVSQDSISMCLATVTDSSKADLRDRSQAQKFHLSWPSPQSPRLMGAQVVKSKGLSRNVTESAFLPTANQSKAVTSSCTLPFLQVPLTSQPIPSVQEAARPEGTSEESIPQALGNRWMRNSSVTSTTHPKSIQLPIQKFLQIFST